MDRFLSLADVERATSLKKSKLYELVKAGAFPAQKSISTRRRAWLQSDVEGWIKSCTNGARVEATEQRGQ